MLVEVVEIQFLDPSLLMVVVEEEVEAVVPYMLVLPVVPVVVEVNPQQHMEVRQPLGEQETHHHNHHHKEMLVEEEIILRGGTPLVVEEEVLALLDKPQHQAPLEMVEMVLLLLSPELPWFTLVAEEEELVMQGTQHQVLELEDLVGQCGGGDGSRDQKTSTPNEVTAASGTTNTGGGGGGGGGGGYQNGAAGGSGIVVVRYQISEVNQGDVAKATGGFIDFYGGKTIHVFLSSGEFKVETGPVTAEMYLVAGGGAGGSAAGSWTGAGGGAGGVVHHPGISIGNGTYTVTVGAGEPGVTYPAGGTYYTGNDGNDSSTCSSYYIYCLSWWRWWR